MSQLAGKRSEGRVHVGAFVDPEQRHQLVELARKRDRSVSSIVRRRSPPSSNANASAAMPDEPSHAFFDWLDEQPQRRGGGRIVSVKEVAE